MLSLFPSRNAVHVHERVHDNEHEHAPRFIAKFWILTPEF